MCVWRSMCGCQRRGGMGDKGVVPLGGEREREGGMRCGEREMGGEGG